MKMVKSLLLGTAAGLVAMTGAQAADLPVKAKPVQYVKICSLYGAGFYYIPGTDMCLKIGGYVRAEYAYGGGNSMTTMDFGAGYNRLTTNNDYVMRARGYVTADARSQSEYGTIRSYIAVGLNYDSPAGGSPGTGAGGPTASAGATVANANRAFIQLAGFTFGLSSSFYDIMSTPLTAYWAPFPGVDTGDGGWKLAAYTAQFGNGLSGTLSVEEPRRIGTLNTNFATSIALGGLSNTDTGGEHWPDIVANLRVDQAWGSAQIMGAVHEVQGGYYGTSLTNFGAVQGSPSTEVGWAVGSGAKINAPAIGAGDFLQFQGTYSVGAVRYANLFAGSYAPLFVNGNSLGYGWATDAVFSGTSALNGTSLNLTTSWTVAAAYEHFWNKQWRTSLYGGYNATSYNAAANVAMCVQQNAGGLTAGNITVAGACDQSWNWWWIGSRTQWNISPDTYLGLDVYYSHLGTANAGTGFLTTITGIQSGRYDVSDQGSWAARFRVHRDFYP